MNKNENIVPKSEMNTACYNENGQLGHSDDQNEYQITSENLISNSSILTENKEFEKVLIINTDDENPENDREKSTEKIQLRSIDNGLVNCEADAAALKPNSNNIDIKVNNADQIKIKAKQIEDIKTKESIKYLHEKVETNDLTFKLSSNKTQSTQKEINMEVYEQLLVDDQKYPLQSVIKVNENENDNKSANDKPNIFENNVTFENTDCKSIDNNADSTEKKTELLGDANEIINDQEEIIQEENELIYDKKNMKKYNDDVGITQDIQLEEDIKSENVSRKSSSQKTVSCVTRYNEFPKKDESSRNKETKSTKNNILEESNGKSTNVKVEKKNENEGKESVYNPETYKENKTKETANNSEVIFRQKTKNDCSLKINRKSHTMKIKGKLSFRKKDCFQGPFCKWKIYYVVVDDHNMQMNFFKSQEDYAKLAGCKMVIDLRFVNEILPEKPSFFQNNFPFKLLRRAGLSTIKLGAVNEMERAHWITTIEVILQKVNMTSQLQFHQNEMKSSDMKNNSPSLPSCRDCNNETATSEQDLIKPQKLSTSAIKLDARQITNIKLKKINSGLEECFVTEKKDKENNENENEFNPQKKFGVNLRRVETEKLITTYNREKSPEFIELAQKFNSLSLSKKRSPKLPFKENLSCSYVGEVLTKNETTSVEKLQYVKEKRENVPKKCSSPNIPLSKSVESVLKDQSERTTLKGNENLKLNLCHATSTVISFEDSSVVDEFKKNNTEQLQQLSEGQFPDSTSNQNVTKKMKPKNQHFYLNSLESSIKSLEDLQLKENSLKGCIANCQSDLEVSLEVKTSKGSLNEVNDIEMSNISISDEKSDILQKSSLLDDNLLSEPESELIKTNSDSGNCLSVPTNISDQHENKTKKIFKSKLKTNRENSSINSTTEILESPEIAGLMTQKQIDLIVFRKEFLNNETNSDQKRYSGLMISDTKPNKDFRFSTCSYHSQTSTESNETFSKINILDKVNISPGVSLLSADCKWMPKEKLQNTETENDLLNFLSPPSSKSDNSEKTTAQFDLDSRYLLTLETEVQNNVQDDVKTCTSQKSTCKSLNEQEYEKGQIKEKEKEIISKYVGNSKEDMIQTDEPNLNKESND